MVPYFKSLAFRLVIGSVLLLALPLCVDAVLILKKRHDEKVRREKSYLLDAILQKKTVFKKTVASTEPVFNMLEGVLEFELISDKQDKLQTTLNDLVNSTEIDGIIFFTQQQGEWKKSLSSTVYQHYFDLKLLDKAAALSQPIEGFYYNHLYLKPYRYAAKKIDKEGEEGVLVFFQNLSYEFERGLYENVTFFPINFALVYQNEVLFSSDPSMQTFNFKEITSFLKNDELPFFEFKKNKQQYIGIVEPLNEVVDLVAYADRKVIIRESFSAFLHVYESYLFILVIGTGLMLFLVFKLYQPIAHLRQTMQKIQQNALETRYQPHYLGYEINKLGLVFNEMIEKRLDQEQRILDEEIKQQKINQEFLLASQFQQSLFPKHLETIANIDVYGVSKPSKKIGGDFYDLYAVTQNSLMVHIGDAADKGLGPCFYSLVVKNYLRALSFSKLDFHTIFNQTASMFLKDVGSTGMFVTLFSLLIDLDAGKGFYVNAGHTPCLMITDHLTVLEEKQIALGLDTVDYKIVSFDLKRPCLLCLYTDGVTEAMNEKLEQFGMARLKEFLEKNQALSASTLGTKLLETVEQFVGSQEPLDDITFVLMKLGGV